MIINFLNSSLKNFFFPQYCFFCSKRLQDKENFVCSQCVSHRNESKQIHQSDPRLIYLDFCYVLSHFDSPVGAAVKEFKYKKNFNALAYIRDLIDLNLSEDFLLIDNPLIVPIPLYWTRRLKRGFNQAGYYSAFIAKKLHFSKENLLIRVKNTETQTHLSREERRDNVRDAFKCKTHKKINKRNIILVDDVFTTGATANECSYALKKNGVSSVGLIALCGGEID